MVRVGTAIGATGAAKKLRRTSVVAKKAGAIRAAVSTARARTVVVPTNPVPVKHRAEVARPPRAWKEAAMRPRELRSAPSVLLARNGRSDRNGHGRKEPQSNTQRVAGAGGADAGSEAAERRRTGVRRVGRALSERI